MDISVDHVSDLKKTCHIFLEKEKFTAKLNSKIEEFRRTAKIKGFRAGKVKTDFIKKKYGKSLEQEMISDLLDNSWKKILEEHKFNPIAQPVVDIKGLEEEGFKASITFEVPPHIEPTNLEELKFEHTDVSVTEENVQTLLNDLLLQHGETETKESPSEEGDVVVADIHKTIISKDANSENDDKVEKMDDQSILMNPEKTLPVIVEKLTGAKAEDTIEFEHSYPEDWHEADIAGQKAKFVVNVKEIQTLKPSTLENVAENVFNMTGGDFSEEAVKEKITEAAQQQTQQSVFAKNKDKVLEALTSSHEFELPESLKERAENEGDSDSVQDRLDSLKLGFIIDSYSKHFDIQVKQEDISRHLGQMAQSFGLAAEQLMPIVAKNKEFQESMYREIVVDNLVKHILSHSKNDKTMISYEEAMGQKS